MGLEFYNFKAADAIEFGVEEAILLYHIRYWVIKNKANGYNEFDGEFWTFNSARAFAELFPFWGRRKISRLLTKLEDRGAIKAGNYNKSSYDQTKWYTVVIREVKNGSSIGHKCPIESPKVSRQYQNTTQNTTQNTLTPLPPTGGGVVYPYNSEKFIQTWRVWTKYKKEQFNFIYKGIISEEAALTKLSNIADDEEQAIKIITNSICNGWKGFFTDKNPAKKGFDKEKYRDYLNAL